MQTRNIKKFQRKKQQFRFTGWCRWEGTLILSKIYTPAATTHQTSIQLYTFITEQPMTQIKYFLIAFIQGLIIIWEGGREGSSK